MKIENGDIIYYVCDEGREVIGTWGNQEYVEDGFLKLYNACFVGMRLFPTPDGPQQAKTLLPVDENGNFSKELTVNKSRVNFWRKVVFGSQFYKEYVETVTGLKIPDADMIRRIN